MNRYIRSATLVCIILLAQTAVYNLNRKESAIRSNPKLNQLALSTEQPSDIIYLGDSVLWWFNEYEDNQTSLGDLVVEGLEPCKTVIVAQSAIQTTVYRAYIEYIAEQPNQPQLVVVPINLRSFSPSWTERPEWQFDDLLIVGREGRNPFFRFLQALNASSQLTVDEFNKLPVYYQDQQFAVIGDFPLLEEYDLQPDEIAAFQAGQMKMDYMYTIDPSRPRVVDLIRLVEVSQENDILIQLYYTPIDYEQGVSRNGEEFRRQVERNIEEINSLLQPYGVQPLNLTFDVPHQDFSYEVYTNEHLLFPGRDYLSSRLQQAIRDQITCLDS